MSDAASGNRTPPAANLVSQAPAFGLITIVAVAAYVAADIVVQLLPPHYHVIRQPESDLAVGPYGWIMNLNFLLRGLLTFVFIGGLLRSTTHAGRSRPGMVFLGIWGLGSMLLGVYATDVPSHPMTLHGTIHTVVALIAFVCVTIGELLLARRLSADPRWAGIDRTLRGMAVANIVLLVLTVVALGAPGIDRLGGLIERLFLGMVLAWMVVAAVRMRSLRPARS